MRWVLLLFLLALLGGCARGPLADLRPGGRLPPVDPSRCLAELSRMEGVTFRRLPDREGAQPGCGLRSAVQLTDVGVPLRGAGAMTCPVAAATVRWLRDSVQPAASRFFARRVVGIDSFGTYACRPRNNQPGLRLSEHGTGNAIDIAAFRLEGGRRVTVLADWSGPDGQARAFLRAVHQGGCRAFRGVLGPDADAQHRDHFHFDMGEWRFCR